MPPAGLPPNFGAPSSGDIYGNISNNSLLSNYDGIALEKIVKMIEDVKHQNTIEHDRVIKRIEIIETSISELSKFKCFNSGRFASAFGILLARICGIDLAIKSISIGDIPSAAPTSRIAWRDL